MRFAIVAFCFLLVGCGGSSPPLIPIPTGSVSGRVMEEFTQDVVRGVKVTVGDRSGMTNGNGGFSISGIPPGGYVIMISSGDWMMSPWRPEEMIEVVESEDTRVGPLFVISRPPAPPLRSTTHG